MTDSEKDIPREPDLGKRLEAIGALRILGVGDENEAWVNCPLSIVLEQIKGARADEDTAWLITPHGEKVPIPSHIAAQIRSIEYQNDQALRVVFDDQPANAQPAYFDGEGESDDETLYAEMPTRAEEPIEDRLHRAFLNGYREGSERAVRGYRWDHS